MTYEGHFSGSGKEKGVDVRLAVDMVYGAARGLYDEAAIHDRRRRSDLRGGDDP